jgi:hypothetical protein
VLPLQVTGEDGGSEHSRDFRPGYWLATRHLTARTFLRRGTARRTHDELPGWCCRPCHATSRRNLRATWGRHGLGSNRRQSCA